MAGVLWASGVPARASSFDVHGFGPVGMAEVGARSARANDGTASYYNPGGLGFGQGFRLDVAPTFAVSSLRAQDRLLPLADPFGVALAFDATVPLTGMLADRIRFGFGAYLLPTSVIHVIAHPGDEPFYPYYDNRSQRLVLIPALAVRITKALSVGAGMNVLAGVSGPAAVLPGASGASESRIDIEATLVGAANAGIRFDPLPHLHLAFAYRQRFAVPTRITTTAEVAGVPLSVSLDGGDAMFDPHTWVLATSFDWGRLTFEVDVSYALWSGYRGPFFSVRAELPGVNVGSKLPEGMWRDVMSLRSAASYRIAAFGRSDVTVSAGAGFEPTILKSVRQGRTNVVDGDKLLLGAGATLVLRGVLPRTMRVGLGGGAQVVFPDEQEKMACVSAPCSPSSVFGPDAADPSAGIDNPGHPVLRAGGALFSMSLGVGVDL
jgi:hypothetical protein